MSLGSEEFSERLGGTNAAEITPTWVKRIESLLTEVFPWMSIRDTRFSSSLGGGLK